MNYAKEFETIFNAKIKREGADKLLDYLKTTDFLTAPASTRFHGNHEGGLAEHSVKVYNRFYKIMVAEYGADFSGYLKLLESRHGKNTLNSTDIEESIAIVALLHDVCKTNCYKTEMRNVKENNAWVQKPYYSFDDPLPYGHGEKSVYMISAYMRLTREEAMAINWHMGGYDERVRGTNFNLIGKAFAEYPMALLFHASDLLTSYLDETITK